jgi:ribosomal protein S21
MSMKEYLRRTVHLARTANINQALTQVNAMMRRDGIADQLRSKKRYTRPTAQRRQTEVGMLSKGLYDALTESMCLERRMCAGIS